MAQGTEQNETIIISETSTEHPGAQVVEVITIHNETAPGAHAATETGEESAVAEIFEALLDPFASADDAGHNTVVLEEFIIVEPGHDDAHTAEADAHLPAAEEQTASGETADHALHTEAASDDAAHAAEAHPAEAQAESHTEAQAESHTEAQAEAQTAAHTDAATDAQHQADAYVAAGDYEAASHMRESAENEAWEAGHNDMLHGSTSAELSHGADEQHQAGEYEHLESQYAAEGNYEAAHDAASHAVEATAGADYYASGADHSGQARLEEWHEGWAVSEQHNAEAEVHVAEFYAESGNAEQAQVHQDLAGEHAASADHQGELGQHDAPMSEHDHSSDVTHDASHDASYDASHDVSHDAGHDASYDAHSYDAHETDV
jgi:hypothetical protein